MCVRLCLIGWVIEGGVVGLNYVWDGVVIVWFLVWFIFVVIDGEGMLEVVKCVVGLGMIV